jgi:hypothetical protein
MTIIFMLLGISFSTFFKDLILSCTLILEWLILGEKYCLFLGKYGNTTNLITEPSTQFLTKIICIHMFNHPICGWQCKHTVLPPGGCCALFPSVSGFWEGGG